MWYVGVPYLKEIDLRERCLWWAQSYFCKMVRRRRRMWRKWANFQRHISRELLGQFPSNLARGIACMEDIKYVNLIEISLMVIEIWGVESSELAVPINNTLVRHTTFLAADTWPCVLILVRHMTFLVTDTRVCILIHCMFIVYTKSLIVVILAACTAWPCHFL